MTIQEKTKEEKMVVVLEHLPRVLAKVLNGLNFHDGETPDKDQYKLQYANLIYDLYVRVDVGVPEDNDDLYFWAGSEAQGDGNLCFWESRELPEGTDDLLSGILDHLENIKTGVTEIEEAARYKLYCTIHNIDHLVVGFLLTHNVEEWRNNFYLGYKLLYNLHQQGPAMPINPGFLASQFHEMLWFNINY